jgi:NADH-quinone oxidoreductase subunit J
MIDLISSMEALFYLAGLIAVIASIKVVTGENAIHALLYLIVSLLAVAVCFYLMGAPFAAGLEVIVYAGAILVLFVFAVMMFGLAKDETHYAPKMSRLAFWFGPIALAALLLFELLVAIRHTALANHSMSKLINAQQVGSLLYGEYLLAVEIASFLLLAGLVAAYHLAKPSGHSANGESP